MTLKRGSSRVRGATALAGLLLSFGCTSSGVGTGTLVEPSGEQKRVLFNWESNGGDWTEGEIATRLPDGKTYRGRYLQVTQTVRADTLAPLWDGWGAYWPSWEVPWGGYYAPYGGTYSTFTRIYGGRVVATLESPDGERMRCRFSLADPEEGLAGGAQGDCQLEEGGEIEYAVIGPLA
jgi:hypothetical protein